MQDKTKRSFAISAVFLIVGVLSLILGFNGRENAISFSMPQNGGVWETSEALIHSFTYIPVALGVFFLVLAAITFTISYYHWFKNLGD